MHAVLRDDGLPSWDTRLKLLTATHFLKAWDTMGGIEMTRDLVPL